MEHAKKHETIVVGLNNEIVEHLDELSWLDDKNDEHVKAIYEALHKLMDYAMDQALARDHAKT